MTYPDASTDPDSQPAREDEDAVGEDAQQEGSAAQPAPPEDLDHS